MAQPYLNAPLVKMESSAVSRGDGDASDDARGPTFTALFDSATVTRAEPEDATMTTTTAAATTMATTTMNGVEAAAAEATDEIAIPAPQDTIPPTEPTDMPPPDPAQSPSLAPPPAPPQPANNTLLPLRTRSSCTNCRQRKQRCDHGAPGEPCKGCVKGGKVCVYPVIPNVPVSSKSKRAKNKSGKWKGELDGECFSLG